MKHLLMSRACFAALKERRRASPLRISQPLLKAATQKCDRLQIWRIWGQWFSHWARAAKSADLVGRGPGAAQYSSVQRVFALLTKFFSIAKQIAWPDDQKDFNADGGSGFNLATILNCGHL